MRKKDNEHNYYFDNDCCCEKRKRCGNCCYPCYIDNQVIVRGTTGRAGMPGPVGPRGLPAKSTRANWF